MDFCPPTGIITFPTRQTRRGKPNNKCPSAIKLVFDMEASTTVSLLTTKDTASKASRKLRRSNRIKGAGAPNSVSSTSITAMTSAAEEGERVAAAEAAKVAIQIAEAAVAKHPPKAKTAHRGAYDTMSDRFGNRIHVVCIDGKWISPSQRRRCSKAGRNHLQ
jgi:hypothetical protein